MNKFPEENDNKKIKSIKKAINEVRNLQTKNLSYLLKKEKKNNMKIK